MRTALRLTILLAIFAGVAEPLFAQANEFYLTMQRRGVSAFESARYPESIGQLRIAAFGLVDAVELYATTQVYLAVAYDRVGEQAGARDATLRLLAAERVSRTYASLNLPESLHAAFETVAIRLLTAAERAFLAGGPPPPRIAGKTPVRTTPSSSTSTEVARPAEPLQSRPRDQDQVATSAERDPSEGGTPASGVAAGPTVSSAPQSGPPTPAPAAEPGAPLQASPTSASAVLNVGARLQAAEEALASARLIDARRIYRELLASSGLTRLDLVSIAEGLYRSRDFEGVLVAFPKLGPLRAGEEPYHFYNAVALYETGDYRAAKSALAEALPHIEITPDVVRYRVRIEGAID